MNDRPFDRFIDLVSFDQKLHSLENKKNNLAFEIDSLKNQELLLISEQEELKNSIHFNQKEVDRQELEMKTLDHKEKEKRQQLDRLNDYKQYQAFKGEIEALQRQQSEQEKYILHAWSTLEAAQNNLAKKTIEYHNQFQTLHETIKNKAQELIEIENECASLVLQREDKEKNIPQEWLEKYTIMRARVANPVVQLVHNSCGACSQMLTSQEILRAGRGALLQCQKCYRLLYSHEIMASH